MFKENACFFFAFTKVEKTLPCGEAFAVWGCASLIAGDLGLHFTSFCIDKNSFAIFSIS